MGVRAVLSKPLAAWVAADTRRWSATPGETQHKWLTRLIRKASTTAFGKDHHFQEVRSIEDFRKAVPIRDYEALRPYVERVVHGEPDILWPGLPLYLSKTSGTTSGVKYIPITRDSMPNHIVSTRNALLSYVHETGKSAFLDGRMIFIQGSPELDKKGGIYTGRLSGIVNHHIPAYLRTSQLPSWQTNVIEDWEEKIERIIDETLPAHMTLIGGIPPWVQMYFDRIIRRTGKKIKDVFPDFSLYVYAGVNFEPYRRNIFESIGRTIDTIELFPASEGFFAYQDSQKAEGMLMVLNSGIFFEFIPANEYFDKNPRRLTIGEVELNKNYSLIINSNAGLWGYSIGDTVKFVSKDPYRLLVTGRIKHFISAFGEHVIGEEVEKAMQHAVQRHPGTALAEFTVAPQVAPAGGLPHHEWLIEFSQAPQNLDTFSADLDNRLRELNVYYDDLVRGGILRPLVIRPLKKNAFIDFMREQGKLGGQNKVPRLSNDRSLAEALQKMYLNPA
jgi:hypothetical protein